MYDPASRSEALSLDISSVNPVLGEREDKVTAGDIDFAVSHCGQWIATVEHDWDTMGGNCLKVGLINHSLDNGQLSFIRNPTSQRPI